MKARHLTLIATLVAILVAGVVAGAGSAGTSGIWSTKVVYSTVDDVDDQDQGAAGG